jgi:SPW repeat
MQAHPLHHRSGSPQAAPTNTAGAASATPGSAAERVALRSALGMPAQLAGLVSMLTGLWVAISPWFLALQVPRGSNTIVNDLIIGLAVAGLGVLTLTSPRGVESLQAASLLAGVWLIISPFILNAKISITAAMYWSNIWSGAIVIVAALAILSLDRPRAAGCDFTSRMFVTWGCYRPSVRFGCWQGWAVSVFRVAPRSPAAPDASMIPVMQ